jgi:hypothetical protein
MKHFIFFLLILLSRLIPHPPNLTPVLAFIILMASSNRIKSSLLLVLLSWFVSDNLLSYFYHYSWKFNFSLWALYNYSAIIMIVLGVKYYLQKNLGMLFYLNIALCYWIWTNFGVWITSGIYPNNLHGLYACYIAALPFLKNSLIGTGMGYIMINSLPRLWKKMVDLFCLLSWR